MPASIKRVTMHNLQELLDSLQVEQLDKLLFRGYSLSLPLPRVFGGQVLAQSINAALRTVESNRRLHSFHSYFLRPGDPERAIIFDVDPIRDGGSFTTRRVVAKQNGKPIFNCSLSFQTVEEGLDHQMDLPEGVPDPETLENEDDYIKRMRASGETNLRPFVLPRSVVDVRRVNPSNPSAPKNKPPQQGYWFKFNSGLSDNPADHQTLLTYISDYAFMSTSLCPHNVNVFDKTLQAASLDHTMWFHADMRVDDWIYYHMDSPRAGHGRGFNRGSFYTRQGKLVVSCAQEGLIRLKN
jgi:acyl-CoA thioesterase-2